MGKCIGAQVLLAQAWALILSLVISGPIQAQDFSDPVTAWKGGFTTRDVPVIRDGVRCGYSQTGRNSNKPGHVILGFWCPGSAFSEGTFEMPISRVQVSAQGSQCVFQCTGNVPCLEVMSGPGTGKKAPSASLFVALPGSCERLGAALQARAPAAEAAIRTEEQKAAFQQQQREEQQDRARRDVEEKEKRRIAAAADCGAHPIITGGPWFSSTYKVAANDEAERAKGDFYCVKEVEYISDAPNPFGGKAARVRIRGYSARDFSPRLQVRDFAY